MNKLILIAAVLCAFGAQAQTVAGSGSGAGQKTDVKTESSATANNGGQSLTYAPVYQTPADTTAKIEQSQIADVHQTYGTQTIRNTPSVSGPPLTSSNDTCMGSASGAVNVPGFGIGLGKTYTDANCVMLKNSREMWNMGMKAAAMALMCNDSLNKEALELTGYKCPQTERDERNRAQAPARAAANEPTDPIVRSRLGLPVIKE